jgi:hypothetical protein
MKSTDEKLRDDIAKAIADVIGHGMREKCHAHAAAVLSILDSQPVREGVTDEMVDAYVNAVNEYLGSVTESQWEADRKDHVAHLRRVSRIGLIAALAYAKRKGREG